MNVQPYTLAGPKFHCPIETFARQPALGCMYRLSQGFGHMSVPIQSGLDGFKGRSVIRLRCFKGIDTPPYNLSIYALRGPSENPPNSVRFAPTSLFSLRSRRSRRFRHFAQLARSRLQAPALRLPSGHRNPLLPHHTPGRPWGTGRTLRPARRSHAFGQARDSNVWRAKMAEMGGDGATWGWR